MSIRLARAAEAAAYAISFIALLAACNTMRQAKLLDPTAFGMEQIAPRVYAMKEVPHKHRLQLVDSYEKAKQRMTEFYGGLVTDPTLYGCDTRECAQAFGGVGDGTAVVERSAILLWTLVFGSGEVAHEWSHLELHVRLAGGAGRTIPMWFHEGLATVVGDIPRHSEAVYQRAVSTELQIPPLSDLRTMAQWAAAFPRYENPEGLNVVYATAGHVVRAWLESVGRQGLVELIQRIKSGEDFTTVYADLAERAAAVGR
jgi:hypothetical protein